MATEGLLQWANAVRLAMATDPSRQLFKDQVQIHGFSFLDDYFDDIISNARQDTLIDLVKTPGRKRIASKQLKAASKLKDGVTLFSTDEAHYNIAQEITITSITQNSSSTQHGLPLQLTEQEVTHVPPTAIPSNASAAPNSSIPVADSPLTSHNELSIIAEDDEGANSSCPPSPAAPDGIQAEGKAEPVQVATVINPVSEHLSQERTSQISQESMEPSSTEPVIEQIDITANSNEKGTSGDVKHDPLSLAPESTTSFRQGSDVLVNEKASENSNPDARSPTDEHVDIIVPLRETDSVPPSPKGDTVFPPLPGPGPLRKSMRVVADGGITSSVGMATPGAPITGKRTSWLQKARQAKALEVAGKKTTSSLSSASLLQTSSTPGPANNAKRKSTDVGNGPSDEEGGRYRKVAKTTQADDATSALADTRPVDSTTERLTSPLVEESEDMETMRLGEDGILNLLKKTVEDFGTRTGKSSGKSLGVSAAASALAEARAAAEARIAERNMKKGGDTMIAHHNESEKSPDIKEGQGPLISGHKSAEPIPNKLGLAPVAAATSVVSSKEPVKVPQLPPALSAAEASTEGDRRSVRTTTPPCTPPLNKDIFIPPPGPVFNKPPPVFKAPSRDPTSASQAQDGTTFPHPPHKPPLTVQSTLESVCSESIFDHERDAWMSGTQETSYTTAQTDSQKRDACDDDDSWPIDEKVPEDAQWIYADTKDDSTTWSSLPSQHNTSQLSGSAVQPNLIPPRSGTELEATERGEEYPPSDYNTDLEQHDLAVQEEDESDLDDVVLNTAKNTIRLVEPPRSESQLSQLSSASSQQSQVGFLGQASKFINNMMGSGKKAQPDVKKVLQKAAVAAKKQQEESDRKATRLKEMENRRQVALQRKAEEEKAKLMEQEKKAKEENERRKREREEQTDKRPLKAAAGRKEDDTAKKRKLEIEKKPELKVVNASKVKSALKQPSALSSSAAYNSSFNVSAAPTPGFKLLEAKSLKSSTPKMASSQGKGKAPTKTPAMEEDLPPPSQIVQTQMAARAKAQLQAAKQTNEPLPIPSESIELPDINSEYSDSEDEDRQRTFDPPDWAQSPELRQALQQQSTINPDDIFGAVRPLKMEELFKTRTSRFRARTSSANWAGADRLTAEEEKEYARRMGFK